MALWRFDHRRSRDNPNRRTGGRNDRDLIGFNILRAREDGGIEQVVNPVWIPALGEANEPTYYRFADRVAAEPGVYEYRIQAITTDGLTSLSDPVVIRRPATP